MTTVSDLSENPPSYPRNGTYADHLWWHLRIWGTRKGGTTAKPGRKWALKEFYSRILGKTHTPEDAATNLKHWMGGANPPLSQDVADRIEDALFGQTAALQRWKIDLRWAHEKSRGTGKNKRTLTAKMLASGPDALSHDIFGPVHAQKSHFATAARENVTLVTNRLTYFFVGRSSDLAAIDKFVNDRMAGDERGLMVITAPPGFGKSALAAQWCTQAETKSHRRIAKHFCALAAGEPTTSLPNIYANLSQQLAETHGMPLAEPGTFDLLVDLLSRSAPPGVELVLWLDGVDEAAEKISCFLPRLLGERVCVIISARATEDAVPDYLEPWLTEEMALAHRRTRYSLAKLSLHDVHDLVEGLFARNELKAPPTLGRDIFFISEGYALLARNVAETALEAVRAGEPIDLGVAPLSLTSYADRELRRLEALEEWPRLHALFALLAIAREAVSIDDLPFLVGERFFLAAFPRQLARWLSIVASPRRERPTLLSFAHPLLREMFSRALGYQIQEASARTCQFAATLPPAQWPVYALRHLPTHLLDAGDPRKAAELLADQTFIAARFHDLGAQRAPALMKSDWMKWLASGAIADSQEALRHHQFWIYYGVRLVGEGSQNSWQQLMCDVGLVDLSAPSRLHAPLPFLQPFFIAVCAHSYISRVQALKCEPGFISWNHKGTVKIWSRLGVERAAFHSGSGMSEVVELAHGAGFVSWGPNNWVDLWGPNGEDHGSWQSHDGEIKGVIALESGGFVFWAEGGSLQLAISTESRPQMLQDASGGCVGAIQLTGTAGFLSWSRDKTIRFWKSNGELDHLLLASEGGGRVLLPLSDGPAFLALSGNGQAFCLWNSDGKRQAEFAGHEGGTQSVVQLDDGYCFLSWGRDEKLRLWSRDGRELAEMQSDSPIYGALELKDQRGFLSWGEHDTLLRWSRDGARLPELRGHRTPVRGALELPDNVGILSWDGFGKARHWDLVHGTASVPNQCLDSVSSAFTTDDGQHVVTRDWGSFQIWRAPNIGLVPSDREASISGMVRLANERGFLTWDDEGSLGLWNALGEQVALWEGHLDRIVGVVEVATTGQFLSWSHDRTLRLWDGADQLKAELVGHTDRVNGALELSGGRGFISWSDDRTLRLWSSTGEQQLKFVGHHGDVGGGREVKTADRYFSWGENTGPLLTGRELRDRSGFMSWADDYTVRLWSAEGQELAMMAHREPVNGAIALANGSGFLSWADEGELRLWDKWGRLSKIMVGHRDDVRGARQLRDAKGFMSWSKDASVKIWDPSGEHQRTLYWGDHTSVRDARELRDSQGIISWTGSGLIRLWGPMGDLVFTLDHRGGVRGVIELSSSGFLSWGLGALRRWNWSGDLLNVWLSPANHIHAVEPCSHPDHFMVAFGSSVGRVYLPAI
ncbi:AAA family ATPase [Sphingomonas sp. AOB5]|uniref:AAA family ATPase n=1 Tax=Sphingomonas sp. AOB5 TaxID=3034017 RepID=UPI0023F8EF51|nr:AAA family ATPase [Sphingomonas sp. AOB5]